MKYCLPHSGPHNTTPREDMSNKVSIITHLFSGSPLRDLVISNIWYASLTLSRYHDPSVSNLSVVLFAWSWMIMSRSWVFSTIYRYFCATLKTDTLVQTSWYWKKNANSLFVLHGTLPHCLSANQYFQCRAVGTQGRTSDGKQVFN